jgi:hypothetical protein
VKFDLGEKNSLLFSGSSFLRPQAKRRRPQSLHVKSDTGYKLTRVREKPASRQSSPGNGGHNCGSFKGTVLRFPSENDPNVCAIVFVRSGSAASDSELQIQLDFCLVLVAFSFIGQETSLALNWLQTKIDWCEN